MRKQMLGFRTTPGRVEPLSAEDATLCGTYWFDLRTRTPVAARLKRLFDLTAATVLLVLCAPLFVFRPVVRERRVGFRGNLFDAYLFRGRVLHELPQLLNVLQGTMSLIGPRALTPREAEALHLPSGARRYCVLPGMTGPWRLARAASEEDLNREYVNQWSLRRDLMFLALTLFRR